MERGASDGLAGFSFVGERDLAASRVPIARKLLVGYLENMIDRNIDLARHRWVLPDGTRIELLSNGGVTRVIVDVRALTEPPPKKEEALPIYEFAAQNPFPASKTIKWFALYYDPLDDPPWRVTVKSNFKAQRLPSRKEPDETGEECVSLGASLRCGATKTDHVTWHGPVRIEGRSPAYTLRGAGDMVFVGYHANRYCNYQVPTHLDDFYWYGTTGRKGLLGTDFGASTPVAEGWRFVVDPATRTVVRTTVTVDPTGRVTATREDTRQSGSAAPEFPEWVRANELGKGFVFGVWKLNSRCDRAISVLHGNPWCFDAYDPGFDVGRLLGDDDPKIGGAFQSGVFEIAISIAIDVTGKPAVTVEAVLIGDIESVKTCGLAYGAPEKNSDGAYWFAADYGADDEVLTARITFKMRDIFEVAYADLNSPPETPYRNITAVIPTSRLTDNVAIDPCGSDSTVWGTVQRYDSVIWWSEQYGFTRTRTRSVDIVLECTGMDDFVLRHEREVSVMEAGWGVGGAQYAWLWSNGTLGSHDFEGYVRAVASGTYTPCDIWRPLSSGFLTPTSMGAGAFRYRYTLSATRDPEVRRGILGIDLRAKTILYGETRTEWAHDVTGNGTHDFYIGSDTWDGCYQESGKTVIDSVGVVGPAMEKVVETSRDVTPDPDPYCDNWGESYTENYSDADLYPLVTKLWHQMVLGKPNPKTPGDWGGFVGPFEHWGQYYPYQMIVTAPDSINYHPLGMIAFRLPQAEIDLVRHITPDAETHDTSHSALLALAKEAAQKAAETSGATPELTDTEETNLLAQSLTTRGEWLLVGSEKTLRTT